MEYYRKIGPCTYEVYCNWLKQEHRTQKSCNPILYVHHDRLGELMDELCEHFYYKTDDRRAGRKSAIKQLCRLPYVPGVIEVFGSPDIHVGNESAVGIVVAIDPSIDSAVTISNIFGSDYGCGMMTFATNCHVKDELFSDKELLANFLDKLTKNIGIGVGYGAKPNPNSSLFKNDKDIISMLENGLKWMEDHNFTKIFDKSKFEEKTIKADAYFFVQRKMLNSIPLQIGSVGGGNHFVEICIVDEICDSSKAKSMGLNELGQVCVIVHSGCRGLGKETADRLISISEDAMSKYAVPMPRDLRGMPLKTKDGCNIGIKTLQLMECLANYAMVNRTVIAKNVVDEMERCMHKRVEVTHISNVSHNKISVEEHNGKTLHVYRKGSCNMSKLPGTIAGSMGSYSFIVEPGKSSCLKSGSHGAGRRLPRAQCSQEFKPEDVRKFLDEYGVVFKGPDAALSEECKQSYNDVIKVAEASEQSGISKLIVRLKPIGVVKG